MIVVFVLCVVGLFIGYFVGVINGVVIVCKISFLIDELGKVVFVLGIVIIDDLWCMCGMCSCVFDGEGLLIKFMIFIENGVLI